MADSLEKALGRIEGKLDQVIDGFKEHREDDTRRFGEVFKRLETHAEDINQAKGAKRAVYAVAAVIAGAVSVAAAAAPYLLK